MMVYTHMGDFMERSIQEALKILIDRVHSSQVYTKYRTLYTKIQSDSVNASLLRRYETVQTELQTAAFQGVEPDGEAVMEFNKLNMILFEHEDISDYLMAKMRYDLLINEVVIALTETGKDKGGPVS